MKTDDTGLEQCNCSGIIDKKGKMTKCNCKSAFSKSKHKTDGTSTKCNTNSFPEITIAAAKMKATKKIDKTDTRLCNCSAMIDKKSKTIGKLGPCKCGLARSKTMIKSDGAKNKCYNSKCSPNITKSIASKPVTPKVTRPRKPECGNKNVTDIYLPANPLKFLRACFGCDDDLSQHELPKLPKEVARKKIATPPNLEHIDEEEFLASEMLNLGSDYYCPHIKKRKVLCDFKVKIKTGKDVETWTSYINQQVPSSAKITTGTDVETCTSYLNKQAPSSTNIKADEVRNTSSGVLAKNLSSNQKNSVTNIDKSEDKIIKKVDRSVTCLCPPEKNVEPIKSFSNAGVSTRQADKVEFCSICTDCPTKNPCKDVSTNIVEFKSDTVQTKRDSVSKQQNTSVANNVQCQCNKCICKKLNFTSSGCNTEACAMVKKYMDKYINTDPQDPEVKKMMEKYGITENISGNSVKSERKQDKVPIKSNEVFNDNLCTCDAELQDSDTKYYFSSLSREMFCKRKACQRKCRRCQAVNSHESNQMRNHVNEFEIDPNSDKISKRISLTMQPYPLTTNITDSHASSIMESKGKKNIWTSRSSDCVECKQCQALNMFFSRAEVVALAVFIVCLIFYLCFTKAITLFKINTPACRHSFYK